MLSLDSASCYLGLKSDVNVTDVASPPYSLFDHRGTLRDALYK